MELSPARTVVPLDRPWTALFTASQLKSLALSLGLAAVGLASQSGYAATINKADNTDNLDSATSWVSGAAPTSADIATWDGTVTTANTSALNNTVTWGGIKIGTATSNPGGNVGITINSGRTLTILAGGGIDLSNATVDLTVGGSGGFLRLGTSGATNTWTVPTGRTLTIDSNVSTGGGTVTLNLSGGGSTFFNNAVSNSTSPLNIASAGTGSIITFGGAATSNLTSLAAGSAGKVFVNGQTVNVSGLSTYGSSSSGSSTFELQSGAVNFNGGIRTSTGDGTLIKVSGGAFSASSVQLQRTANFSTLPSAASATSGFVVTGGTATVTGNLDIGTNNSSASALVSGGSLTVGGQTTIGNTSNTRYSVLQVSGGSFTSTNAATGIVLSAHATTANRSELLLTGGTTTAERIAFGIATSAAGSAGDLVVNGANTSLYVGSGGIVLGSQNAYTATISISGGATIGAKADWTSPLPINLSGPATFQAADISDTSHDISLGGALSGTGSLTKTGDGTLTLSNINTYTGATNVDAGMLLVSGALSGSTNVNSGGSLGGTGSVADITLNAGGMIEAGSTTDDFTATSLTWNGAASGAFAQMKFELSAAGNTSDKLTLSGALTKGTGITFLFDFQGGGATSQSYTLLTFTSQSGFSASDFTYTNLAADLSGSFDLQSNALVFTVVPEPASAMLLLGGTAWLLGSRRPRRRSA